MKNKVIEAIRNITDECVSLKRNKQFGSGKYKYQYTPATAVFDAVRPLLKKHNLSVLFFWRKVEVVPSVEEGTVIRQNYDVMLQSGDEEEYFSDCQTVIRDYKGADLIRRIGMLHTYVRKQFFISLFNIDVEETEVGETTSGSTPELTSTGTPPERSSSRSGYLDIIFNKLKSTPKGSPAMGEFWNLAERCRGTNTTKFTTWPDANLKQLAALLQPQSAPAPVTPQAPPEPTVTPEVEESVDDPIVWK